MNIALISANMWLLPPPFSSENKKRIDVFARMISEHKVDFVCLQEVWLNTYVEYIRNTFSSYYFIGSKDVLFNKTGLLILSKHEPLHFEKYSFKYMWEAASYDSLARKGWLFGQFKIKGTKVDLLNIQLNCPVNKRQFRAWEKQYGEVRRFVNQRNGNLIVVGDLNGTCTELLQNSATIKSESEGIKSFSRSNPYNRKGFHKLTWMYSNYDLDIDYVMLFPRKDTNHITKKLILEPLVSDHYPIYAVFEIQ